jgi:hypothetical protein
MKTILIKCIALFFSVSILGLFFSKLSDNLPLFQTSIALLLFWVLTDTIKDVSEFAINYLINKIKPIDENKNGDY